MRSKASGIVVKLIDAHPKSIIEMPVTDNVLRYVYQEAPHLVHVTKGKLQ